MFDVNNKGKFEECYSGVFIISLENIFEVCDEVWFDFIKEENLAQVLFCEFPKMFKNAFFLKAPPVAASVQLYRIWMDSKAFLIDFYYWFQNSCYTEQFPSRVTLSFFRTTSF